MWELGKAQRHHGEPENNDIARVLGRWAAGAGTYTGEGDAQQKRQTPEEKSAARPRGNLRGPDGAGARAFVSFARRQEPIAAGARAVWRGPRLQPHGVVCRARHDGQEYRRVSGVAAASLYGWWTAGTLSRAGQVDC